MDLDLDLDLEREDYPGTVYSIKQLTGGSPAGTLRSVQLRQRRGVPITAITAPPSSLEPYRTSFFFSSASLGAKALLQDLSAKMEMGAEDLQDEKDGAHDSRIDHEASLKYWNSVSPDVNGMLNGFSHISRIDLRGSQSFLLKLRRLNPSTASAEGKLGRAVDCGAGIGRVTEGFLSNVADVVDIVEPVEQFVQVLRSRLQKTEGKIGDIYVVGLERWTPEKTYDLIWIQWCVGHLTDGEMLACLTRCSKALATGGWIVLKENVSTRPFGEDDFDDQDSCVTRSDQKFRNLFARASLTVVKADLQGGFPKGIGMYPVKMYALRPREGAEGPKD